MNSMNRSLFYSIFLCFSCPLLAQESEPEFSPAISFFASEDPEGLELKHPNYQTEVIISLLHKKPKVNEQEKVDISFTAINSMELNPQGLLQLNIVPSDGLQAKFLEKTFIKSSQLKESNAAQRLMAELLKRKKADEDIFVKLTWSPALSPMNEKMQPMKQVVARISPDQFSTLSKTCGEKKVSVSASSSWKPLVVSACCAPLIYVAFCEFFLKSKNNI